MWKELSANEEPKGVQLGWGAGSGGEGPLRAGVCSLSLVVVTIFYIGLKNPFLELLCCKWTGGRGGKRRRETGEEATVVIQGRRR